MSFGQTLRDAREAKGLSQSELASKTNLLVQVVNGLENEDFRMIPAPIYGRGFVKLYCEAAGIDPKPLQEEFMHLYRETLNAPPKIAAMRPASAKPSALPAADAIDAPKAVDAAETIEPMATEPIEPEPIAAAEPQPRKNYGDLFEHAYHNADSEIKPSAAEKFRDTMSNVSHGVFANVKRIPPNIGRMITVGVGAVLILVFIGWGVYSLYQATSSASGAGFTGNAANTVENGMTPTRSNQPEKPETEVRTAAPATDPKLLESTGPKIPSLYID